MEKTEDIHIRTSKEEKELIQEFADREGLSLSEYCLEKLMDKSRERKQEQIDFHTRRIEYLKREMDLLPEKVVFKARADRWARDQENINADASYAQKINKYLNMVRNGSMKLYEVPEDVRAKVEHRYAIEQRMRAQWDAERNRENDKKEDD